MKKPAQGNPLEGFIYRTRSMVKKYPRLMLAVGVIWLVNSLACIVLVGIWLVWELPGRLEFLFPARTAATPTSIAALQQAPGADEQEALSPTLDCGQWVLTLGETRWQVASLPRAADGSIPIAPDSPGTAFRVEDNGLQDLFVLSSTAGNLALVADLQAGIEASFGSERCNTTLYTLSAPVPGAVDPAALEDGSTPGLVLFIADSDASPGLILRGEPTKLIFSGEATPVPGTGEVSAGVSFLETANTSDGSAITVRVEIYNYGGQAFTLTADDVALVSGTGAPLAPSAVEPGLPREFKPAERAEFLFSFPKPGEAGAVFKVFSVEFNLDDFR